MSRGDYCRRGDRGSTAENMNQSEGRTAVKAFPLSVGMTPAYYDRNHALLRAQLRCLAEQTCKDFDVWLIDPHYSRRRSVVPELAEHYRLNLVHVPYQPNTHVAKIL